MSEPAVSLRTPAERARHWSQQLIAIHDQLTDATRPQRTQLIAAAIGLDNLANELEAVDG